ncbi:MAG: hypothetical protein SFV22_07060 [Saprospiraceae bacterium]|nr:hypothetical protein [Saprospiraceae bacterium]
MKPFTGLLGLKRANLAFFTLNLPRLHANLARARPNLPPSHGNVARARPKSVHTHATLALQRSKLAPEGSLRVLVGGILLFFGRKAGDKKTRVTRSSSHCGGA